MPTEVRFGGRVVPLDENGRERDHEPAKGCPTTKKPVADATTPKPSAEGLALGGQNHGEALEPDSLPAEAHTALLERPRCHLYHNCSSWYSFACFALDSGLVFQQSGRLQELDFLKGSTHQALVLQVEEQLLAKSREYDKMVHEGWFLQRCRSPLPILDGWIPWYCSSCPTLGKNEAQIAVFEPLVSVICVLVESEDLVAC
jgi:hypothetical protein